MKANLGVITIEVPELGNRSYVVHDGKVAIVIDPSRRITQIIDKAKDANLEIKAIFETHIHNDYITGGFALSKKLGVPYYISGKEHVHFKSRPLTTDQTVKIGNLNITALASPGHTDHHLSYLVELAGATAALFSGGSLLYGAVGRPDLVSDEATPKLAKAQYQTAKFYANRLDHSTLLYPTHGFGSFCAVGETDNVEVSTIAKQLETNTAYTSKDETSFTSNLIDSLDVYPSYYGYMAPANLKGPLEAKLDRPKLLTKETLEAALHTGANIVDLRTRLAYALKHRPGTFNIELSDDLATYVGWLISWDEPLILVGVNEKDVANAQEKLSLIGRDIIDGQMEATDLLKLTKLPGSYPVQKFEDLKRAIELRKLVVIDVRRKAEWQKDHIKDAVHIPLHELGPRLSSFADQEIWIHCASGFRASIAASMASGKVKKVVLIDDKYLNAARAGLITITDQDIKVIKEVMAGQALLVDVRDKNEWQEEHAKKAVHIPVGAILEGNEEAEILSTDKKIYLYCENGERSSMAEITLKASGFDVVNIGGLIDWIKAGGQTEVNSGGL